MADASLLPRRIVKETQRLLSEPGARPLRVVSAPLHGVIAVARHALDGTSLPPPRKLLLRSLFGTLVSRPRSPGSAAPGISATPYQDNLRYFNVIIAGPQSSPYESAPHPLARARVAFAPHVSCPQVSQPPPLHPRADGIFKLELFLPEEYPMAPPKVRPPRHRLHRLPCTRPTAAAS